MQSFMYGLILRRLPDGSMLAVTGNKFPPDLTNYSMHGVSHIEITKRDR